MDSSAYGKINRDNIEEHLFNYQLEMVGKTIKDCIDDDNWKFNFTLTRIEYGDFRDYSLKLIRKILKVNKAKAILAFERFYTEFGMRIKN